jgi:hypothetical protein
MTPQKSYYDGNHEIIHTVIRGESLSAIAERYKFRSWQPIWIYNTQKEHMLDPSGNPNSLEIGQHLFIPRSKEGYQKLLKKLEILKLGLVASGASEQYRLDSVENEYKAEAVLFDLAGDVATFLGSLSVKVFEVARLRRATVGLKGAQRFAAEIQLRKGTEELADAVNLKELKKAVADGAAGWQANKLADDDQADYVRAGSTFATKTVDKVAKAASELQKRQKLGPALRKVVGGPGHLLDIVDIALDYVKVSNVANAYLWLTHGETVDDTLKNSRQFTENSVAGGLAFLHEKILGIQKERDLLYHAAPVTAQTPSIRRP